MEVTSFVSEVLGCPACGGDLEGSGDLDCKACDRRYPTVRGIPDLRLGYEDPYVTHEEDVARARELDERFDELDFAGLLREHWQRSGKRPELAERFMAGDLVSIERSKAYIAALEERRGPLGPEDRFLEIGCGTAGLATAASGRAGVVVASDVSLRWLVLARKRLQDIGCDDVRLVCCSAEDPPFKPRYFDVVAASDVIEHAARQHDFVAGLRQILRSGGLLFLATPNRFSLGLEPHVRLWGVGLLPRGLAPHYVRAVRKAPYDHVRLLSAFELRRVLRGAGYDVELVSPDIPTATQQLYRGAELWLVRLYNRVRALAPARLALSVVGPFFHVFATKGD